MPSNKNRAKAKAAQMAAQSEVELTGGAEIVYHSVAIMPVLRNKTLVYSIVLIGFTAGKTLVTMEEIDSARTPSTALAKLQNVASNTIFSLPRLRAVAKQLKKGEE